MKNKGFEAIELMICVAIIGILAAVAIPKFANLIDLAKAQNLEISYQEYVRANYKNKERVEHLITQYEKRNPKLAENKVASTSVRQEKALTASQRLRLIEVTNLTVEELNEKGLEWVKELYNGENEADDQAIALNAIACFMGAEAIRKSRTKTTSETSIGLNGNW